MTVTTLEKEAASRTKNTGPRSDHRGTPNEIEAGSDVWPWTECGMQGRMKTILGPCLVFQNHLLDKLILLMNRNSKTMRTACPICICFIRQNTKCKYPG